MAQNDAGNMSSPFYLVKHTFRGDKKANAQKWFANFGKLWEQKHPAADGAGSGLHEKLGVWNHFFMPVGANGEAIYCLWETKVGMWPEDFQVFLDSENGPSYGQDCMNNNMYPLQGQPQGIKPKYSPAGPVAGVPGMNSYGNNGSSAWYMVEHHFKTEKHSKEWWGGMDKMMADMDKIQEQMQADGVANPLMMFCGGQYSGRIFCLWEVKAGKTADDLQKVLEGPYVSRGHLVNTPYLLDLQVVNNQMPMPSKFA